MHRSSLCGEENANLHHMFWGWIQILFFKTNSECLTNVSSWWSEHCRNSGEHIPSIVFLWGRWQNQSSVPSKAASLQWAVKGWTRECYSAVWGPESTFPQTSLTTASWADSHGWRDSDGSSLSLWFSFPAFHWFWMEYFTEEVNLKEGQVLKELLTGKLKWKTLHSY